MRRGAVVLALVGWGVACGGDAPPAGAAACATAPDTLTLAAEYAPQLNVDLSAMQCSATGLHWQDLANGQGEPAADGQLVRVFYTGWLPDGSQFDSNAGSGETFGLVLGAGNVITGWEEGLQGMRAGGKRRLVIPPHLAYGTRAIGGVIPANATLVFDVEVVEIVRE